MADPFNVNAFIQGRSPAGPMPVAPSQDDPLSSDFNEPVNFQTAEHPAGDIASNAIRDLSSLNTNLRTQASALAQRTYETLVPQNLVDSAIPLDQKLGLIPGGLMEMANPKSFYFERGSPSLGLKPAFGWTESEGATMLHMLDMGGQAFDKTYGQPIRGAAVNMFQGKFKEAGQELGKIVDYGTQHPLYAGMDAATGVGAMGIAARELSALPKPTPRMLIAGAVQKNITDGFYRKLPKNIKQALTTTNAANILYQMTKDPQFYKQLQADIAELERLEMEVPKQLRGMLVEAGEYRNIKYRRKLEGIPEVQAVWKQADMIGEKMKQKMLEDGLITEHQALKGQYQTAAETFYKLRNKPRYRLSTKPGGAPERLPDIPDGFWDSHEGIRALREIQRYAAKSGKPIPFVGIVHEWEAAQAAGIMKGGDLMRNKVPGMRSIRKFAADEGGTPASLMERQKNVRTPDHTEPNLRTSNSLTASVGTRAVQNAAVLRYRQYFRDIMDRFGDAKVAGVDFDVHKYMKLLAGADGPVTDGMMADILRGTPESVKLPKEIVDALQFNVSKPVKAAELGGSVAHKITNTFKHATLMYDMYWAAQQAVQTSTILNGAMFRGPKDIVPSMLAYKLASDKNIPKGIWVNNFTKETAGYGVPGVRRMKAMTQFGQDQIQYKPSLGGALKRASRKTIIDFGRKVGYVQAYSRGVATVANESEKYFNDTFYLYNMLKQMEDIPDAAAMKISGAYDKVVQAVNDDLSLQRTQFKRDRAGKEVDARMGVYGRQPSPGVLSAMDEFAKAMIPFYPWLKHSVTMTMKLPETPVKYTIANQITKQSPYLQSTDLTSQEKQQGGILVTKPDGSPRLDRNGLPLVVRSPGFSPFTQSPELALQMLQIGISQELDAGHPGFNPLLNLYGMTFAHTDPASGADFSDPSLIHDASGSQYRYDENKDEYIEMHPTPNMIQAIAKATFPKQEAEFRDLLTYPYRPTALSWLDDQRIDRDASGGSIGKGEPFLAPNMLENRLQRFFKVRAQPQKRDAATIEMFKQRTKQRLNKNRNRQERELDPSVIPDVGADLPRNPPVSDLNYYLAKEIFGEPPQKRVIPDLNPDGTIPF